MCVCVCGGEITEYVCVRVCGKWQKVLERRSFPRTHMHSLTHTGRRHSLITMDGVQITFAMVLHTHTRARAHVK